MGGLGLKEESEFLHGTGRPAERPDKVFRHERGQLADDRVHGVWVVQQTGVVEGDDVSEGPLHVVDGINGRAHRGGVLHEPDVVVGFEGRAPVHEPASNGVNNLRRIPIESPEHTESPLVAILRVEEEGLKVALDGGGDMVEQLVQASHVVGAPRGDD